MHVSCSIEDWLTYWRPWETCEADLDRRVGLEGLLETLTDGAPVEAKPLTKPAFHTNGQPTQTNRARHTARRVSLFCLGFDAILALCGT